MKCQDCFHFKTRIIHRVNGLNFRHTTKLMRRLEIAEQLGLEVRIWYCKMHKLPHEVYVDLDEIKKSKKKCVCFDG